MLHLPPEGETEAPIAQLKRREMEREKAAYAAARGWKTDEDATAAEEKEKDLREFLLTDAIADYLQRQATRDVDLLVRANMLKIYIVISSQRAASMQYIRSPTAQGPKWRNNSK